MKLSNTKILIIDDDEKFRLLARKILENQGVHIFEASNLTQGLKRLEEAVPDLVLLDLNLGLEEHGSQFLKLRNANPRLLHIPVIICSSDGRTEVVKKVIDLGVSDYILKPFRPDWFLKKITRCLRKSEELTYQFSENEMQRSAKLSIQAEVLSLGEANCVLRSPVKFARHSEVSVSLKGLGEFQNQIPESDHIQILKKCRNNGLSRPSLQSQYDSLMTMLGVSEKEAMALRKLKSGWRKK
jgi:DNA-binding response OmpR family regulator